MKRVVKPSVSHGAVGQEWLRAIFAFDPCRELDRQKITAHGVQGDAAKVEAFRDLIRRIFRDPTVLENLRRRFQSARALNSGINRIFLSAQIDSDEADMAELAATLKGLAIRYGTIHPNEPPSRCSQSEEIRSPSGVRLEIGPGQWIGGKLRTASELIYTPDMPRMGQDTKATKLGDDALRELRLSTQTPGPEPFEDELRQLFITYANNFPGRVKDFVQELVQEAEKIGAPRTERTLGLREAARRIGIASTTLLEDYRAGRLGAPNKDNKPSFSELEVELRISRKRRAVDPAPPANPA